MPDKILVVDDNPITRKMLQLALTADGFEVNAIGLASEVDEALRTWSPDLVLLDLVLPDATGFDVLAKIRTTRTADELPVLAVTGLDDEDRILKAGFTDHLLKPTAPAHVTAVVRSQLRAARTSRGPLVLVVDDNDVQLELMRYQLCRRGFQVSTAQGACEALASARHCKPDAIVSDIAMPEVDGFQLCRAVRSDPELADIPFVLASSRHLDCADRDLGMRSGATAIVPRTPDLDQLVATVRDHVRTALSARVITRPDLPSKIRRTVIMQHENPRPYVSHAARIWRAMPVVLDRVSDPPEVRRDVVQLLDEVLTGLLDASGFALGLVYTCDGDRFELRSQLGFSPTSQRDISDFFGNPGVLQRALDGESATALDHTSASQTEQDLLARAQVGSMLIAPLIRRGTRIGVIVLASLNPAVPPDWLELARAARWPIAQASVLPGTASLLPGAGPSGFRQITESLPDGLVVADATQRIVYANPAAERILGRAVADLIGQPVSEHLSVERSAAVPPRLARSRLADQRVVDIVAQPVASDDSLIVYTLRDLTERMALPELARGANHDPLTGLFNRRRFDEALEPRLAEARRYGRGGALLLLDIDGLKAVNDRFGRAAGNAVLCRVGEVLLATTRDSDVRARLGGDDFAILLPHASAAAGERCARKILAYLTAAPVELEGTTIPIEASIGIAVFPDHGVSQHDVVAAVESALYRAKRGAQPRVCAHQVDDVVVRIGNEADTIDLRPECVPSRH
jgi:diguanylate cyclase (GGDEF)-like protein/PAS domain S-box-containing protein